MDDQKLSREERVILEALAEKAKNKVYNLSKHTSLNWETIYRLLLEHSIFLVGYECFFDILPKSYKIKWKQTQIILKNKARTDIRNTLRLCRLLEGYGISFSIAKGAALSIYLYDNPVKRQFSDVDVYINKPDYERACRYLLDNDYLCEALVASADYNYELLFETTSELGFRCVHNPSTYFELKTKDTAAQLDDAIVINANNLHCVCDIGGGSIPVFDETTTLYYFFMNAYKNHFLNWGYLNQSSLKDLFDIATWVNSHGEYNYTELKRLTHNYGVSDCIRTIVQYACSAFDVECPEMFKNACCTIGLHENTIETLFHKDRRKEQYFTSIMSKIDHTKRCWLETNKWTTLASRIRVPLRGKTPGVLCKLDSGNQLVFRFCGLGDQTCYIDMFVWNAKPQDADKHRNKISLSNTENSIIVLNENLCNLKVHLDKNTKELRIPFSKEQVFIAQECASILIEIYIRLVPNENMFTSWASVGGEHEPVELAISKPTANFGGDAI